ncbi:hypothetical protein AB0M02_44275 [Actinoplanes sp. NPDC051861]|uniref:hypothetical protein n=1 Tax=Actinoplanes sp. NPDC051861 TaxID=3155170 RepID=UPI003429183D
MATLVPCLVALRSEFNALFPGRDKASDGWIGDPAHQARDSDHNPDSRGLVHAIDVDRNLGSGADMQAFVDHLVARHRTGADKRLFYIIYNRRIWSASRDWTGRAYTGDNLHTEHAHFSASYTPARERDASSWRLEEVPVALTDTDLQKIDAMIGRHVNRLVTATEQGDTGTPTTPVGHHVLSQGIPNPIRGKKTTAYELLGDIADAVTKS